MRLRRFIGKAVLLGIILILTYLGAILLLTRGFVADDYAKFTHQSPSLIIGLSRAHYGLDPVSVQEHLTVPFDMPIQNFAFEKSQSPYGEVYLEAVRKKITAGTQNGVFILGVSPGSFSVSNRLTDDQAIYDFDSKMMVGKVKNLNRDPNFEFVRKCYGRALYKGIWPHEHRLTTVFHSNGWEEFKLEGTGDYRVKKADLEFWKQETIKGYTSLVKVIPEHISEYRLEWFQKTVAMLQSFGSVYIVRLPMHPEILKLEDQVWPDFDDRMHAVAKTFGVEYLNYARTGETFETYDASHLYSASARSFSVQVARDINKERLKQKRSILLNSLHEGQSTGY